MNLIGRIRDLNPRRLGLTLLAVVALLPVLLMWYRVSTNWVPLPMWDEWHTPASQFDRGRDDKSFVCFVSHESFNEPWPRVSGELHVRQRHALMGIGMAVACA